MPVESLCRCLCLCLLLSSFGAWASEARERVGLVLSGGGARGLAHIGVLQALEELRVPVDAIAGTSMGAVVGGIYASGRDASSLRAQIRRIQWSHLFSDQSARQRLPLRRKREYDELSIDPNTGITDKWQLRSSTGILQGQHLGLFLRQQIGDALIIKDFNRLPIPFRAVAADLETGQSVVLGRGNLADAIQASMTVPGVFAPMPWGERLLVDGGIANNLPVNIVHEMLVDRVIAVNISDVLLQRDQIQSVLSVADQMTRILVDQNVRQQRARLGFNDVYIQPPLQSVSSTAFKRAEEIVEIGHRATMAVREQLAKLALSEAEYRAHRQRQQARRPQIERLDYVAVQNHSAAPSSALRQELHQQPLEPLDYPQIERDLSRLYAHDHFSRVSYDLSDDSGLQGLIIQAQDKAWGPGFVRLGLYLEDRLNGENRFDLRAAYWRPNINAWGGELGVDVQAGGAPLLGLQWYQPLGAGSDTFLEARWQYGKAREIYELRPNYRLEVERDEGIGALQLGHSVGNVAQLSLGLWRGRAEVNDNEATLGALNVDSRMDQRLEHQGFVRAHALYDSLDHAFFARSGSRLSLTWEDHRERYGDDQSYQLWSGQVRTAFGNERHRMQLLGRWGHTDGDFEQLSQQGRFALGGFLRLSGLGRNSRLGNRMAFGAAVYHHFFQHRRSSRWGRLFAGGSLELGNTWFDGASDTTLPLDRSFNARHSGSLFVGTDTFLGPLYFALGVSEGGEQAFYLFLGNPE